MDAHTPPMWLRSSRIPAAIGLLVLLAGGSAGAGEIVSRIFEDGACRRGEEYVRARNVLVGCGKEILPLLEQKRESKDWQQRMFAQILVARIDRSQEAAEWNQALAGLVSNYSVFETARSYREPDWEKLPDRAADVPASHVVDVLWEHAGSGSSGERRKTAAALQFYLAPRADAVEAVVEILAPDPYLKWLAREGLRKLGPAAIPALRQVLQATIPPAIADPHQITRREQEAQQQFWIQMRRAAVAAYALARLEDDEAVPLMVSCLKRGGRSDEYIETLSESLAHLGATAGIDAILDHALQAAADRRRTGDSGQPGYDVLRSHLASFDEDAVAPLQQRLRTATEECDRIIMGALIEELSGAEGKAMEVAALRETLWFDERVAGLLKLHELTGEDIFERLHGLMLGNRGLSSNKEKWKNAILAFGTLKETRAVPILAGLLKTQHASLEDRLTERAATADAKPFDPQAAREAAHTFDRRDTYLATILDWGDTALLALRRIGGPQARAVVADTAAYSEYKVRAETSLLLIDGDVEKIVARLDDKDRAAREEAALALLEIGDRRATGELLRAAARRQGPSHLQWRQRALASAENITAELRQLHKSDDVRRRVLAEAMILEEKSPEKAARCRELLHAAAQSVAGMHVIRIGMIEAAGRHLVARKDTSEQASPGRAEPSLLPGMGPGRFGGISGQLDQSDLPLVEAACLFDQGVIRRGVAAFALAQWKQPRSMPVLAASFNMGSLGGSNPAALALADFGPRGAELAAKVPPPAPGEHDTGLRMTSHRAGARVLAEQKDVRGIDEILKGLKTLEEDRSLSMWSYRAGIYLSAAEKFHDQRLIEPLLRILKSEESLERSLHAKVTPLLAAYDDPRLVPLFTKALTTREDKRAGYYRGNLHEVALVAITRRLGEKTPEYLIEQLAASTDESFRGGLLLGLGELSYAKSPPHPGDAEWSADRFKTPEERTAVAAKTRKLAYPLLTAALDDPSPHVNYMAAVGLTILAQGSRYEPIGPDTRSVGPLTRWCKNRNLCFHPLAGFLGTHGDAETGKVLLEVLKSQPAGGGDAHLVGAIGKLKPPGAVAVLSRNVRASFDRYKSRYASRELGVLTAFGDEGTEALLAIFNEVDHHACRLASASLLAQRRCPAAVEPMAAFLRATIAAGPGNPRLLPSSSESNEAAYIRTCRTLFETLEQLASERAKQMAGTVLVDGPGLLRAVSLKIWAGE